MLRFIDNARMRWKIMGCAAVVLALLTAVAAFAIHQLSVIDEQAARVTGHDVPSMQLVAELDTRIADVEVAVLRHLASSDGAERREQDDRRTVLIDEIGAGLDELDELFGDEVPAAWASVRPVWVDVLAAIDRVVVRSDAGDDAGAYSALATEVDAGIVVLQRDLGAVLQEEKAHVELEGAQIHAEHDSARTLLLVAVGLALLLGAGASWLVSQRIVSRLARTADAVRLLGEGDLRARPDVGGTDELGEMARALSQALDRTQATVTEMGHQAQTLAAAAEELSAVSTQLASSSAETTAQASSVAENADHIAESMNSVASGTEEIATTIREISTGAHASAEVSMQAVQAAEEARLTVAELARSSEEINAVVQLIAGVAEQTNLLALNATIEAARAGEAGRGFAVVAGEVKDLARQTASATTDIAERVKAIQAASGMASEAIEGIGGIIASVRESSTTIAAAVEEQTAATQEITKHVQVAADGTAVINAGLDEFARAADDTTQAAATVQIASTELAGLSSNLQALVGQFRV